MNELFSSAVAVQRRSRAPAALSVGIHALVVVLAVILPPIVSMLNVLVIPLGTNSHRIYRVNTGKMLTRVPVPAKVIARSRLATDETVKKDVHIGAFDRSTRETELMSAHGSLGEVVLGRLNGGPPGDNQLEPTGPIGPTDAFTTSGPSQKQGMLVVEHAVDGPAQLLSAPVPTYSAEAKRLNVTGQVVLEVKLTASGEVHVLRVLSSLGHGLDEAAIEAVNQTRCRPAFIAGRPVDVIASIRVLFKLT